MLGYLWQTTRGYRLAPWKSPYLSWRMETYWGGTFVNHANGHGPDGIPPADFARFVWRHRGELFRFLRWADRMRSQH